MTYDILESLGAVGYDDKLLNEDLFSESINEGFKNDDFRSLITWLANEINYIMHLDEKITENSDLSNFWIELSGFLKAVNFPFESFTGEENMSFRGQTVESRYLLLESLINELMTQKMLLKNTKLRKVKDQTITIVESRTALALKDIAITLNLGKPPENISAASLFEKINQRLDEHLKNIPDSSSRLGQSLFNPKNPLNNEQWERISKIQSNLDEEYNLRRKMLMTRFDVTIQSFKWSDKISDKGIIINEVYSKKIQEIEKMQSGGHQTDLQALLAARDKIAIMEKTSSANVRKNTKSKLQRYIIGKVPDRGGRALDRQKPPPEMPSWQKRQTGDGRGGRGGGGGINRGNFRGKHHQNQGPPQGQHFQQRQNHNPSNQSFYSSGAEQQQDHGQNYNNQNRGHRGGRVQGNWNSGGRGRGRF